MCLLFDSAILFLAIYPRDALTSVQQTYVKKCAHYSISLLVTETGKEEKKCPAKDDQ